MTLLHLRVHKKRGTYIDDPYLCVDQLTLASTQIFRDSPPIPLPTSDFGVCF